MKRNLIKAKLMEKEVSQVQLAQLLNIGYTTLNSKLKSKTSFTLNEVKRIRQVLNLTDEEVLNLFLSEDKKQG